jgi:hypothetical protein
MHVGTTQSQSLIASVSVSFTSITAPQKQVQPSVNAPVADILQVGGKVDAGFAQKVLRNSVEESMNAAFEAAGIDLSADGLKASEADRSPSATAKLIVDFAVGFFAQFKANHSEEGDNAQIEGFVDLVKGAVEAGFSDAREILGKIGNISGDIEADIDETFQLAMKGIDDFAEEQRGVLQGLAANDDQVSTL